MAKKAKKKKKIKVKAIKQFEVWAYNIDWDWYIEDSTTTRKKAEAAAKRLMKYDRVAAVHIADTSLPAFEYEDPNEEGQ